ncbi:hypothetical protein KFK09_028809 [Dendrobium nobile]|uniref:Uncharacterized protein n=1 Tax=Dendrobium nobile TaxID=94219 RepID=A0A8T3A3G9_DENNO|nr:hypothetical protein KFK09_028809 [Dendrobium nobile]
MPISEKGLLDGPLQREDLRHCSSVSSDRISCGAGRNSRGLRQVQFLRFGRGVIRGLSDGNRSVESGVVLKN